MEVISSKEEISYKREAENSTSDNTLNYLLETIKMTASHPSLPELSEALRVKVVLNSSLASLGFYLLPNLSPIIFHNAY